jgi:folate/biopterin transporter
MDVTKPVDEAKKIPAVTSAERESFIGVLRSLKEVYGWRLLGMLACSQWVCKGMVWGFCLSSMDFLFRDYAVSGPHMQVYKAIVMLPWAMKPLFGLVSDGWPIMGYQKAPYMIIVSVVAVMAHFTIGLSPPGALPIKTVVVCLLLGCMQISVVDLLTEAKYAERIRERPERGPDLMTYVWGGITVGNLFATACVGVLIEHLGTHWVFAIIAIPASIVLVPTVLNWLEEPKMTQEQVARKQADLWEQKEIMILVMLTGIATLVLVTVGLIQDSVYVNLAVALIMAIIVVSAFTLLLHPMIGRMNCFFFIQTCCVVDISGASFYFFTNDRTQYPEGPHFSKIFFASALGVFVAMLNLVGMYIYNRTMQHWRYHGLFIFANLLVCIVSLASLLVYTRFNLVLGIPDTVFVMSTWGIWAIVHMWMWLPGVVLLSQLCPRGVEATMYALLAGCHNLGLACASYLGAFLLRELHIAPTGAKNESHQFQNLWVVALIQAVAPVLTLAMLPWMIPNALQTTKLLESDTKAVDGSPWQRLTKRQSANQYGSFA